MLKKRIIACLVIKNSIVVQSIEFKRFLPIGSPLIAAKFLNQWGIDEITILDIDATPTLSSPNFELVKKISRQIFVPLSVGGGIKNINHIRQIIKGGADKIIVNTGAFDNPQLISQAAKVIGAQSVVVSVDVKKKNGKWQLFTHCGKIAVKTDLITWIKQIENLGAGEILLRSIDRDGSKSGFDTELIKQVTNNVSIPVIAAGGTGKPNHFLSAIKAGASAVAAGNYFHFTEHSPILIKSYLKSKGVNIRLDTDANYSHHRINSDGRLLKSPDSYLEDLKFQIIKPEVI
ncbi:MAG: Histidine biosynthesis protein [candidate division CPR1 bacterium GW2011_GWA2_42_17]|uniref:imidazole glycerol-phosphate synthase n=1 Tax=candidate division CPR1 bacterium GW2011_GWA2_42_17 TaxID=1618341 RepID=A0A0G1B9I6_9BACT|nr:MAG: Histidine biosynthesis protein [candidate division CPR1 bacterium GW2011_GWA2_42_17]